MSFNVVYAAKDKIQNKIAQGVILPESLIITNEQPDNAEVFYYDEKGKLNIAPKNDVKALPISKADVDNFNKIYKEIKHKLDRFYIIYNKCKKKFINIKDKAEKLTNTNTSFVLTTFSDIVGSFVLIKRLSSLDYGKMIMAVKKSF